MPIRRLPVIAVVAPKNVGSARVPYFELFRSIRVLGMIRAGRFWLSRSQNQASHLTQIADNKGAEPSDFVSWFEEVRHHDRHHAGGRSGTNAIVGILKSQT